MKPAFLLFIYLCLAIGLKAQSSEASVLGVRANNLDLEPEENPLSIRESPLSDSWETQRRMPNNNSAPMQKSASLVSKTVNVSAGGLSSALTATEKTTVTNLSITGTIDARDFKTMRDSMTVLSVLDLSGVTIAAYSGDDGSSTYTTDYPANYIPEDAFYLGWLSYKGLTSVTFPTSLEGIGDYAFFNCKKLSGNLVIPSNVTTIGNYAFDGCYGFNGFLTIPSSVKKIGNSAFRNCSGLIGNIIIPESIDTIEDEAFRDCSGFSGSLTIPGSVTTIGNHAFFSCSGFSGSLTIPGSVTTIGVQAFAYCDSINGDINIPSSTTEIGVGAFCRCMGSIVVDESNPNYSSANGILFNKNKTKLLQCPTSKTGGLTFLSTVSEIDEYAFYGCTNLTGALTIPSSVKKIGSCAFSYCKGFTGTLTIPFSIDSIHSSTFRDCENLSGNLTIPSSVTYLGSSAFRSCKKLEGLTLSSRLKYIDGACFSSCSGLKGALTIPATVDTIESNAFYGCSGLTGKLTIGNSVKYIGSSAFEGCTGFNGTLTIGNSVKTIGWSAFRLCTGIIGNLKIPDSVTSLGAFAFDSCVCLNGILTLSNSLKKIPEAAFQCCRGLTGTLTIPDSVKSIDGWAFYDCSSITGSVTMGDSVKSIGQSVFYNCSGITELTLPSSLNSMGSYCINRCSSLKSIYAKPQTPVDLSKSDYVFYNVNKSSCKLYVPKSSQTAYQTAYQWQDFYNIVEMDETDVESIKQDVGSRIYSYKNSIVVSLPRDKSKASISIYDLNGTLITSKTLSTSLTEIPMANKGIYVARLNNAGNLQTQKLIIQ